MATMKSKNGSLPPIIIPGADGEDIYVPKEEWDSWHGSDAQKRDIAFAKYSARNVRY
jgi:hypothetical protein